MKQRIILAVLQFCKTGLLDYSQVLYCIVLYCIVLYCIVLYCIVLYCIVLYCIVLYNDLTISWYGTHNRAWLQIKCALGGGDSPQHRH